MPAVAAQTGSVAPPAAPHPNPHYTGTGDTNPRGELEQDSAGLRIPKAGTLSILACPAGS